jgi:hypothetical protein
MNLAKKARKVELLFQPSGLKNKNAHPAGVLEMRLRDPALGNRRLKHVQILIVGALPIEAKATGADGCFSEM